LKRLESKGLIKRAISAKDRRTRLLYITPAGRRLLARLRKVVDAAQLKIVEPLNRRERTQFMDMMRKLVELNNDHSRVPLRLETGAERGIGQVRPRRRS
jgi:DNA-binding MarR family transcriptional regulator